MSATSAYDSQIELIRLGLRAKATGDRPIIALASLRGQSVRALAETIAQAAALDGVCIALSDHSGAEDLDVTNRSGSSEMHAPRLDIRQDIETKRMGAHMVLCCVGGLLKHDETAAPNPLTVAAHCSGVVIVCDAWRDQIADIVEVERLLESVKVPCLGFVLDQSAEPSVQAVVGGWINRVAARFPARAPRWRHTMNGLLRDV